MIPILDTPTGLKRQPTPLIHTTLSFLADTLVLFLQKCFQEKGRTSHTFMFFGAKCWAKIPIAHGDSKLDPRSTECRLLGYALGSGNYKVQDVVSCCVFISHDVVFEEGSPRHTSAGVGEETEPTFDIQSPPADHAPDHAPVTENNQDKQSSPTDHAPVTDSHHEDQINCPRRIYNLPNIRNGN